VAEAAGLFKKHGIEGTVSLFDVGLLGAQAILAGQADTAGTVEFPLVALLEKRADLVIPAVYMRADDLKIVVGPNIQQPSDLEGKKIGLIVDSSGDYSFDRYLRTRKMSSDKIKIINVSFSEQVPLLAKEDLDGFVGLEPLISRAIDVTGGKAHLLKPNIEVAYKSRLYLSMSRSWTDGNPEATAALLRTLIDANDLIVNNSKEAAKIVAKRLNLNADAVDRKITERHYDWKVFLDRGALDAFNPVIDWMESNKRSVGPKPDMSKVFAPRFLKEIDPALVQGI
jgi:NitT/TauT family transport system substrate-binding protein